MPGPKGSKGPGTSFTSAGCDIRNDQRVKIDNLEIDVTNSTTIGGNGPFATGSPVYRQLGWAGVLPIITTGEPKPPGGFTGWQGKDPSDDELDKWEFTRGSWNVGLRLPRTVVVIDVDCYDGKNGCAQLAKLERELGPLPPTWSSTSRQDGSRKMFFSTSHTGKWHDPGDGVEILHWGWRYARVWPSVNPKTNAPERWFDPSETLSEVPPKPVAFPPLPAAWEQRFTADVVVSTTVETGSEKFPWNELLTVDVVPPGDQDNLLARAARSCRATNDSDAVALLKLSTLVNKFQDDPSSRKGPWTQEHVLRKWEDVKSKHAAGRSFDEAGLEPWMLQVFSEQPGMTDSLKRELVRESDRRAVRRLLDEREAVEARGERPKRDGSAYAALKQPAPVLPGKLAAEVNLLGGPSEAGKSLLARDWALEVANSGRNVLWIASEGLGDFDERWVAHPLWSEDVASRLRFLDEPVQVTHDAEVDWLLKEYDQERPALVVFDLIYDMGIKDDNSFEYLNPMFKGLKRLSATWDAATLALGHNYHGSDRRFRGSSSWRQRCYVEWHMADNVLSCEKFKIGKKPKPRAYAISFPTITWIEVGETINEEDRLTIIQKHVAEFPEISKAERARQLAPVLGLSVERVRAMIRTAG